MEIILASSSPRRKELLSKIVKNYRIIPSSFDEEKLKSSIKDPEELVKELSYGKATEVLEKVSANEKNNMDEFVIIAADTIVYFDGNVLGKPKDEKDAFNILSKLQGNENYVYTGMTVFIKSNNNHKIKESVCTSKAVVKMKNMSKNQILDYIETKEPLDKAGAYAIQGIGNKYIESYIGSFDVIVRIRH